MNCNLSKISWSSLTMQNQKCFVGLVPFEGEFSYRQNLSLLFRQRFQMEKHDYTNPRVFAAVVRFNTLNTHIFFEHAKALILIIRARGLTHYLLFKFWEKFRTRLVSTLIVSSFDTTRDIDETRYARVKNKMIETGISSVMQE